MLILFWDFLITEQIFLSPQVKRRVIISNKLEFTICLSTWQTILDLGSEEIRKNQKNLKTSSN